MVSNCVKTSCFPSCGRFHSHKREIEQHNVSTHTVTSHGIRVNRTIENMRKTSMHFGVSGTREKFTSIRLSFDRRYNGIYCLAKT